MKSILKCIVNILNTQETLNVFHHPHFTFALRKDGFLINCPLKRPQTTYNLKRSLKPYYEVHDSTQKSKIIIVYDFSEYTVVHSTLQSGSCNPILTN